MSEPDHVTLNRTGDKMPIVGFGTWKVPNDSAPATVEHAIKCGYRLFDTVGLLSSLLIPSERACFRVWVPERLH